SCFAFDQQLRLLPDQMMRLICLLNHVDKNSPSVKHCYTGRAGYCTLTELLYICSVFQGKMF
ncbi:MAG: hypothetical protein MSD82_07920, partial [Prevotella sp.]|nr:hypothetical protein [Prevotella sp.]